MFIFLVSEQGCFLVLGCQAAECDFSPWKEPRASFASRIGWVRAAPRCRHLLLQSTCGDLLGAQCPRQDLNL